MLFLVHHMIQHYIKSLRKIYFGNIVHEINPLGVLKHFYIISEKILAIHSQVSPPIKISFKHLAMKEPANSGTEGDVKRE